MLSYSAVHLQSDEGDGHGPCLESDAIQLDVSDFWSSDLAKGQSQCFVLRMTKGSFARLRLSLERGYVRGSLFAPADQACSARTYAADTDVKSSVLGWAAVTSGNYILRVESNT
jgi:hypothetical protein